MAALIFRVVVTTTAVRCRGNPTKHHLMCPPTRKQYRPLPVGMVTVAHCTCGRGEEKVYSETRDFYCQGPPHCGDGSGNSDCWCDDGTDRTLGNDGLYRCYSPPPPQDGDECLIVSPLPPGGSHNIVTARGTWLAGTCHVDPLPTCTELSITLAGSTLLAVWEPSRRRLWQFGSRYVRGDGQRRQPCGRVRVQGGLGDQEA